MLQRQTSREIMTAPLPIHLGAFLKMLRDRHGISQAQVLAHLPGWKQSSYSKVEKDTRAPTFDQLVPIYAALAQAGVHLTLQDRRQFILLAKKKIEGMKTRHERKDEADWEELRFDLARVDRLPVETPEQGYGPTLRGIAKPRFVETRHLIGREEWLASTSSCLQGFPPRKLLIIQGPVGIGKSSELHRLARQFLPPSRFTVVLCDLPPVERTIGPESSLDMMLGEILGEVGQSDAALLQASLETRIAFVLSSLERAARPVLLFIDNAENMLDEQELAWCWERFLRQFLQWQHQATLILATKEWGGWFEEERAFVEKVTVPSLDVDAGITLLQRLGLQEVPFELLRQVHEAVGGVPQGLKWVASLVQNPIAFDSWDMFDLEGEETTITGEPSPSMLIQRIQRLLDSPAILGGPMALKLKPLLDRVLEKRLSPEARQVLYQLSVADIALGKHAVRALCPKPSLLHELRNASLLVSYDHRVQVLPLVAAALCTRLSAEQKCTLEGHLAVALFDWLTTSGTLSAQEMGTIITELAEIYLKHHRLLDAAQFIIRHGWLSFRLGHARRLAQLALKTIDDIRQEKGEQPEPQQYCGARLLSYFLAPFLGHKIDASERVKDYHFIRKALMGGTITLQPLTEVYLVRNLVAYTISQPSDAHFEEAQTLFSTCRERMTPFMVSDPDLQAALHEVHALLLTRWSDFAEEQAERQRAAAHRAQVIQLYREGCDLLTHYERLPALAASLWKKRLAKLSTNLGYQLNLVGHYEEALPILEQSILLKEEGCVEPGSLAYSYGEKAQALQALGRYEEALRYDALAVEDIERLARAGDTVSQEERWIYLINRASLYLQLQRVDEAETLLREAIPQIELTRRKFSMLGEQTLKEIEAWREHAPSSIYQRDWRWIGRLREASSFNAFWWLAYAGPFSSDEQREWQALVTQPASEEAQKQREAIISQSRQRELAEALAERREPHLWYPAIPIEEVRFRIDRLHQLDADMLRQEPNGIVRDLYHGKIEEEVSFLRLIEAAYTRDRERFWELNQQLHPVPTQQEMQYALNRVKACVWQGSQREGIREASEQVMLLLRDQLQLSFDPQECEVFQDEQKPLALSQEQPQQCVSAGAAQRFFEAVLREGECEGWQVMLDANASGARVEAASRLFILPERTISLEECKALLQHEVLNHIADIVAGEHSPLGLLAVGTRNYMPISEGLALYHEMQAAKVSGRAFDDSKIWLGALSAGLAGGVCTPPQSFLALYTFLKAFLVLYRLLRRPDEDRETTQESAHSLAQTLCLRTFRGVPDLQKPGVCYSKDVCYLRGLLLVERAVAEDETIIDRLSIGRIGLEYLPVLSRLGIAPSLQQVRKRIHDTDLDGYILSFEERNAGPTPDTNEAESSSVR
jgi:tetratricopeptide (TPR) repeat protein/transcriptional regulator with XRE-family HTH domain